MPKASPIINHEGQSTTLINFPAPDGFLNLGIETIRKPTGKRITRPKGRFLDHIEKRFNLAISECNKRKGKRYLWRIGLDDFRMLCSFPCWYCDGKLGRVEWGKGLDRIDNEKDYTMDNVYPCCTTCNRIKGHDLSASEAKVLIAGLLIIRNAKSNFSTPNDF